MITIKKLEPFKEFCLLLGEEISAYDDNNDNYLEQLTYVELLTWLCNYLENVVIPTVNNNGEAVEELQALFIELKSYVDNYLDSPEFLSQVSDKLDLMATDGTLDRIINTNITGSLANLNTTNKSNLVSAINEVNTKSITNSTNIGTLSNLATTEKTNVVGAINEVNTNTTTNATNIGVLSNLNTTNKTNIVSAINETNGRALMALPVTDIAVISEYWTDTSATPKTVSYPEGFTQDNCVIMTVMWEDTDPVTYEYTTRRFIAGDGIQVSLKASNISILNTYSAGTVYVVLMKVNFGVG